MPEFYTPEEFASLCNAHNARIMALGSQVARSVGALDEDLPDAIQDALLAVLKKIIAEGLRKRESDKLGNPVNTVVRSETVYFPRSYFRRVVENRILSLHRNRKLGKKLCGLRTSLNSLERWELELLSRLDDLPHLTNTEIRERIERLCEVCQTLIQLRFYDDLTFQQICDELASEFPNEAAVRRKIRSCLNKIIYS